MTTHVLKTDASVFEASWNEIKSFELRQNDRNFRPTDSLILKETVYSGKEMAKGKPLEFTGRVIEMVIDYILHGPCYGIKEGWVVMACSNFEFQDDQGSIAEMADQAM